MIVNLRPTQIDFYFKFLDFDTAKIETNTEWRAKCASRNSIVASFEAQKCRPIDRCPIQRGETKNVFGDGVLRRRIASTLSTTQIESCAN